MAAISLPAQIVRTRRFTLGVPGQVTVAADGASVLFLRSPAGHDPLTCLWSLDLASGTERLLADPAALLGAPPSDTPAPPPPARPPELPAPPPTRPAPCACPARCWPPGARTRSCFWRVSATIR